MTLIFAGLCRLLYRDRQPEEDESCDAEPHSSVLQVKPTSSLGPLNDRTNPAGTNRFGRKNAIYPPLARCFGRSTLCSHFLLPFHKALASSRGLSASEIRGPAARVDPDFASLHPGYDPAHWLRTTWFVRSKATGVPHRRCTARRCTACGKRITPRSRPLPSARPSRRA